MSFRDEFSQEEMDDMDFHVSTGRYRQVGIPIGLQHYVAIDTGKETMVYRVDGSNWQWRLGSGKPIRTPFILPEHREYLSKFVKDHGMSPVGVDDCDGS